MEDFQLPDIPGIEGVIEGLKLHSMRTRRERLVALDYDGHVVDVSNGDAAEVYATEGMRGMFLCHNHPHDLYAFELSSLDLRVCQNFDCTGVLAVCDDGTISWTSGLTWKADYEKLQEVDLRLCSRLQSSGYAKDLLSRTEMEWCYWAHCYNDELLKEGLLKDYHLKLGVWGQAFLDFMS